MKTKSRFKQGRRRRWHASWLIATTFGGGAAVFIAHHLNGLAGYYGELALSCVLGLLLSKAHFATEPEV